MASKKFKDIPIGQTFEFDRLGVPFSSGMASGPWIKTAARKYTHVDGGPSITVGSTAVKVISSSKNPATVITKQWKTVRIRKVNGKVQVAVGGSTARPAARKRKAAPVKRKSVTARKITAKRAVKRRNPVGITRAMVDQADRAYFKAQDDLRKALRANQPIQGLSSTAARLNDISLSLNKEFAKQSKAKK